MRLPSLLSSLILATALLPATADARLAYVTEPLRLYAGPGPDYPQIATLPPGLEIDVAGCMQGYQWCDVMTRDGLRGWLWSGSLSFSWGGDPMPVIRYAPSFGIPLIGFIIGDYWGAHYRDRPWYDDRRYWRPPPPPAMYRPPPPPMEPPRPGPGWGPGWGPGRDHDRGRPWHEDRRDPPRQDFRPPPPPRMAPNPPPAPPRMAPPPGAGGPQLPPPRREPPRMEAPRPPGEGQSPFRPPPGSEPRGPHGDGGRPEGRGPENRFGGRM